jgi:hypothetical protein
LCERFDEEIVEGPQDVEDWLAICLRVVRIILSAFEYHRPARLHVFRCLTAYPLVILEDSVVRLRVLDLGPEGKGFGIFAQKDIVAGEIIYELPGLVAIDATEEHSHLSSIIPHPEQGLGSNSRVFFGPIRFINHRCHLFNVGVSGFSLYWIFTDYQ